MPQCNICMNSWIKIIKMFCWSVKELCKQTIKTQKISIVQHHLEKISSSFPPCLAFNFCNVRVIHIELSKMLKMLFCYMSIYINYDPLISFHNEFCDH